MSVAFSSETSKNQFPCATLDLTAGVAHGNWFFDVSLLNATDTRADLYRFDECTPQVCGAEPYILTNRPRTLAIKFGQSF